MATARPAELEGVFSFLGFGNPHGPVWFIGQEERLPQAADPAQQLLVRSLFPKTVSCHEAHAALGINHLHGIRGGPVVVQSTWRQMSYLMLCLRGEQLTPDNVRQYQADVLGSPSGATLLTELLPLPKPSARAWPYGELLAGVYNSAADYQAQVWPLRRELLRDALTLYRPKLVVCYGSPQDRFKELFTGARFFAVDGTAFVAAHHAGRSMLLVPHFSQWYGAFPTTGFLNCAIGAAVLAGIKPLKPRGAP